MDADALAEQIVDLQARVAFQEDLIQALNTTVAEQDQALTALKLRLQRWESKLDDLAYSVESSGGPTNEKPPHY